MSKLLEHIVAERVRGDFHKEPWDIEIPDTELVGKRGGRKIPLHIEWKPSGTGMFQMVFSCGCTALYPYVRYEDGNGNRRLLHVEDWVKQAGFGKAEYRRNDKEFTKLLQTCADEKDKIGGRVAEIVLDILKKGGSLTEHDVRQHIKNSRSRKCTTST